MEPSASNHCKKSAVTIQQFRKAVLWKTSTAALILVALATAGMGTSTISAAPLGNDSPEVTGLSNDSLSPELRRAYAKFRAREITDCLELLKEACEKDPSLPPAHLILAQLYFNVNQVALGRGALEQGVLEYPDYPDCYLTLADLAWREGRVAESALCYDHALELAKKYDGDESRKNRFIVRSLTGQVKVLERRQQWDRVLEKIEELLAVNPDDPQIMHQRGIAMFKTGTAKEAYEALKEAREKSDDLPPAAVTLGRLYEQAENREKANEWMIFAAKEGRLDAEIQAAVARWLWETEQYEEAKKHAEIAVQLDEDNDDAKLIQGIILRYLKEYAAAEKVLEQVYLRIPDSFDASNQMALVLIDQEDERKHARALALAQVNASRFEEGDRRYFLAHATLGWIQYQMKKIDEAERSVKISAGTSGITSDMAYFMACISVEREKQEEAKRLLKRALDTPGPFAYRESAQALYDRLNA